ncbi:hypothetical protein [Cupriavidus sp. BIC8F]|uniref:hypothetical protein n=1 Tax=Cupriavidus sp. BIC8F TaxID=3079014 RepID=UPI002915EC4B|nr:hypothetical protein [Cupriavidus sp. BIC8F]
MNPNHVYILVDEKPVKLVRRHDGPVVQEVRASLVRIKAEIRRMLARVAVHRKLRAIDREERRAVCELQYLRHELEQHERSVAWLEIEHRQNRKALLERLAQLAGGPQ